MPAPNSPRGVRPPGWEARRRRNQQRFVERRKEKVQDLVSQVEQLQEELQALELQKVHDQAQLQALAEFAEVPPKSPTGTPAFASPPARDYDQQQHEQQQHGQTAGQVAGAARSQLQAIDPDLYARAMAFRELLANSSVRPYLVLRARCLCQGPTVQGFSQLTDETAATVSDILTVIRGPGAPGITPAECKKCTPAGLASLNEELLCSLRALLQGGAEVEGSAMHRELVWLMSQYVQMKHHVYNFAKFDYITFVTEYSRLTAYQHGPAPPDDVQQKLAALQLTSEQRPAIAALTRTMIAQLSALSQQHRALDDCEGQGQGQPTSPAAENRERHSDSAMAPSPEFSQILQRCSPQVLALREGKLQELLTEMQAIKVQFDRGFIPLLSPVQFARLVTVTPFLCDVNALGIAVVESMDEPGAAEEAQWMRGVVAGLLRNAEPACASSRSPAGTAAAMNRKEGGSPMDGLPEDDWSDVDPADLDALMSAEEPLVAQTSG